MARRRNFHVPLSDDLYAELRQEAARTGRPATALARDAIAALVQVRRRRALHEAIASYAARAAGTRADFDPDLERAAFEQLLAGEDGR
jgi:predicted transcriptional regulator